MITKTCIQEYIDNEIQFIENQIDNYKFKYKLDNNDLEKDLKRLQNLSDEEIEDIQQKVNDDEELWNKIYEIIHYYLYH